MGKKSIIGSFTDTFENQLGKEVKRSVIDGTASEFFSQLMGFSLGGEKKSSVESPAAPVRPRGGDIFDASLLSKSSEKKAAPKQDKLIAKPERRAAAIEYYDYHKEIINAEKKASRKELGEMNNRIQQIQVELKKLIATSRELQVEFGGFTVQQTPKDLGTYYINFFEWLLLTIRTARQKVENSKAWLNTVKGKGKHGKKADYWDLYKQHGTSFGLSSERTVATQVG